MLELGSIPFGPKPPLALLGLDDAGRQVPDADFCGFGWCRPAAVWLDDGEQTRVEAPLLVALHSPDDAPADAMTLEFWFDFNGSEVAAQVPWERFVAERIVPILGSEREVVLALCNPHRVDLPLPAGWGRRRLHFADGDVTSWLDEPGPHERVRLTASRWRRKDGADGV